MHKFVNLNDQEEQEPQPGLKLKFVHAHKMTLAFWKIKAGTILPEHYHIHEQVSVVTKGEIELSIEGNKCILTSGMVAVIPGNANHSAKAITDCEVTDAFYPCRRDFIEK